MNNTPITLISGTRKGIGKFLAQYYVEKGHYVIGCSRSDIDWNLDNYQHWIADVSDEKAVKKMFSMIKKEYGKVDNVINNAGIASMNHSLLTPISTVNSILNANLVGTFLFSREAAKLMKKNKYGRIINFSTVAVPLKLEGEAIYASSKAAIISLTEILAREFGEYGITVNSIGPTPIKTDLIRSVPENKIEELLNRQSIKRFGTFEDIANVIDFYIDKRSSFITGQNIYLGGV
ncbi:SDR family oxidoreductase [Metabacillus fastidiosus]|uniref:SDR family NAD(P)-dependent oxidoreductase n=1 Tax=Metabacillus fastidiosus TaxID=1458 RepID=UPI002E1EBA35|nr:SDR family NAD(P)-dependent oxidoreductase [Metabacillus fastidiosus]